MNETVRFEDATPEVEQVFLDRLHERYPGLDADRLVAWYCGRCGGSFPREDLLLANGELKCPIERCGATGRETIKAVVPRPVGKQYSSID